MATSHNNLLGTRTELLTTHLCDVRTLLDGLAPPETRDTTGRRSELVQGLLETPEFQTEMLVPYKRYVEVNRTGNAGKAGKRKHVLEVRSVSRREFAMVWWAQFRITVAHKYEVGICDAFSA